MGLSLKKFFVGAALITASFIPGLNIGILGASVTKGLLFTAGSALVSASMNRRTLAGRQTNLLTNIASEHAALPVLCGTQRVGLHWAEMRLDPLDSSSLYMVGAIGVASEDGGGIEDVLTIYFDDVVAVTNPDTTGALSTTGVAATYSGNLSYAVHLGTDAQAVDATLNSVFAADWPSTSKGAGIAYVVLKLTWDPDVFPAGLPSVQVRVQGNKLFDPRTSTTVYSENPALMVRDYLLSTKYGGGIAAAEVNDTAIENEADYCDEIVNTTAYNSTRFLAHGAVDTGAPRIAALQDILSSCRGQITNQDGGFRLYINKPETVETFELNESNIVGDWDFVRVADVPNMVTYSYVEPGRYTVRERFWPAPGVANAYLTADNGIPKETRVDLPFTTNKYIAEQIASVALKEARNDLVVGVTAKEEALKLQVGDVVNLTHSTPAWTDKPFRVAAMGILQNFTVRLVLREYTAADYNLDTQTTIDEPPGSDLPDPFGDRAVFLGEAGIISHTMMGTDAVEADNVNIPELSDITPDMGTLVAGRMDNAASSPTAGVRLDSGSAKPGTWARYLDLAATGTDPFLFHDALSLNADGSAEFGGTVRVDVPEGNEIEFTDGATAIGSISAAQDGTGFYTMELSNGVVTKVTLQGRPGSALDAGVFVEPTLVLMDGGGTFRVVSFGANDSGGSGFRMLRVPNT